MKHLEIGQCQKAPNFSAFHWSPRGRMFSIGQHFVTTRVVHLPKRTETSLITESDQSGPNHKLLQLCTATQPGPIRTRLCGPCIAAIAGLCFICAATGITGLCPCHMRTDKALISLHIDTADTKQM